jgi:hypothetical protein
MTAMEFDTRTYDLLLLGSILGALSRMGHSVGVEHAVRAARLHNIDVDRAVIATVMEKMQSDRWNARDLARQIVES